MTRANVDKPTKTYTIHASDRCTYVMKIGETPYKGVNVLKRDGGWFAFDSLANARASYQKAYADYKLVEHC